MQDTSTLNVIFYVLVLLFSVVIHEVAHGIAARRLGDRTAEHEGRLTLNPLVHIDPFGSIILPLLLVLSHSPFLVGWAKPVPYNPYNFDDKPWIRKWGEAFVAFAGPFTNILIFLIFGLFLRFLEQIIVALPFMAAIVPAVPLISTIVIVNIVLAVFNLVPLPPLDGSKILFSVFPPSLQPFRVFLERYALFISLFFILFLWQYITPVIYLIYNLVVGA
jgi:Zn-dependent protease